MNSYLSAFTSRRRGLTTLALLTLSTLFLVFAPANRASAAAFEPNENILSAYGPLIGATPYLGAIETVNDVDYFYVYTPGVVQMQFLLTNTGTTKCALEVRLSRPDNDSGITTSDGVGNNSSTTMTYTSIGPRKYMVKVRPWINCDDSEVGPNATYKLELSPASAFTTVAPAPPVTPDCAKANKQVASSLAKLKSLKAKKRRAHGRKKKRRLAKQINSQRFKFKTAVENSNTACAQTPDY